MNCEFQMEASFTIDALSPEFIFGGLKGEIIDYVISSYTLNMKLIYLYYWRPELQIHCGMCFNGTGKEPFVHLHTWEKGIYHAKFILITTTEMLRFIIMTTNITEQMCKNCLNDYYVINIPRCKLSVPTPNTEKLYQFFKTYDIHLKSSLMQYDWKKLKGNILISIPGCTSHAICYTTLPKLPKRACGKATICTTAMKLSYDIRKVFHVQEATYQYMPIKREDFSWLDYSFANNVTTTTVQVGRRREPQVKEEQTYQLEVLPKDHRPYHYKRYTIDYISKKGTKRMLIITSANLSLAAWGTPKTASANAELGIAWNSEFSFN